MKLNKVTIICLTVAAMLTAGIVIVQAAGFVSYEDGNKIAIWDNVHLENFGLKMSNWGENDSEVVDGGIVKILDKDIFVRGILGFECSNYPDKLDCKAAIGNVGNAFLVMDQISSNTDLTLESTHTNITLNTRAGSSIIVNGKLLIKGNKNLIATDYSPLPNDSNEKPNVYVNDIKSNQLFDNGLLNTDGTYVGLTFPNIKFDTLDEGDAEEAPSGHKILFYPKRIIKIDLTGITAP